MGDAGVQARGGSASEASANGSFGGGGGLSRLGEAPWGDPPEGGGEVIFLAARHGACFGLGPDPNPCPCRDPDPCSNPTPTCAGALSPCVSVWADMRC